METKFKVIVETGQGRAVYPADDLGEAVEIYREQLGIYADSQIHLVRDMPDQPVVVKGTDIAKALDSRRTVEKHKGIDSRYLKQQTEGADTSNPLYGKVVVMSGTFEQIGMERDQVAGALQSLGAKVNRSVSSTIQVFVTGNKPGPSKIREVEQLRASGRDVRIISQIELKEILDKYLPNE